MATAAMTGLRHEEIKPEEQFFSYTEGGVVCPRDAARGTSFIPLPLPTLKVLRHMQRSHYAQVKALEISPALHDDLERILQGYISHLLERRLQSADFIRRLRLPQIRQAERRHRELMPPAQAEGRPAGHE